MANIPVGLRGERSRSVSPDLAVDFLGVESARVLGTPWMIMLFEMTARDSLLPLLGPGQDSVGTEVNIRHLAATPLGMNVIFRTEVIAVDDRRVRFKVEAFDDREQIADGTHERFVVDVKRFAKGMAEKSGSTATQ